MVKLYMLNRGDRFIWPEDGKVYEVDHHDCLATHAKDNEGKVHLLYAPTEVEEIPVSEEPVSADMTETFWNKLAKEM